MYFQSITDFLAMGGHGLYVWLAYGIALIVLAYNIMVPVLQRRQLRHELNRLQNRVGHS